VVSWLKRLSGCYAATTYASNEEYASKKMHKMNDVKHHRSIACPPTGDFFGAFPANPHDGASDNAP